MLKPQPKFLTKLKASADAKREALNAEQKALDDKAEAEKETLETKRDVEREDLAKLVKDSTDKNRQFFVLYIGLWLYVLSMVVTTTDQMLLDPSQGIKLPFVDVPLPLLGFYWVAPLFLIAIHLNLLQNLESHHYKLMRWCKACGGEVPRSEIPAFLFDYHWLERGSKMEWLVRTSSHFLFLQSGPFALGVLMWRFTDYQDIIITSWHFLAFVVDCCFVWLAESAFRKHEKQEQLSRLDQTGKEINTIMCKTICLSAQAIIAVVVVTEYSLAWWFHSTEKFPENWSYARGRIYMVSPPSWIAFVGEKINQAYHPLFSLLTPVIEIDPNKSAWLPDKKEVEMQALLTGKKEIAEWWQAKGEGLDLTGRHLRGFSAQSAFLPRLRLGQASILQGAGIRNDLTLLLPLPGGVSDLQGANLIDAQLQGANLIGAQLQGANLELAKLQGANLSYARLQGASLKVAQLQGADLNSAQLHGADLSEAQLQGANLNLTKLQGANLDKAQLQGASLFMTNLQWADLSGAQLQGANLRSTKLQGADLNNTQLQGIIIHWTAFQHSRFSKRMGVSYLYKNQPMNPHYLGLRVIEWVNFMFFRVSGA